MKVAIRTDSSIQIGSGHVMRCLTLAQQLKKNGGEVIFICSDAPGHMATFIQGNGYPVYMIPTITKSERDEMLYKDLVETRNILQGRLKAKLDYIVVDHYNLDAEWETPLQNYTNKVMVIDDLANRPHNCDILLDQNFYLNMNSRYNNLVPEHCNKLLGPRFALLRSDFYKERDKQRKRDGHVRRIQIFFGGSDPTNETVKALRALHQLKRFDIAVDVVVGMSNPNQNEVKQLCHEMDNANYYCQVENMAELMGRADLAIGAGGTAALERCFLGLPTIVVCVADNQIEATNALAQTGVILNLGTSTNVKPEDIFCKMVQILDNPNCLKTISHKATQLVQQSSFDSIAKIMLDLR